MFERHIGRAGWEIIWSKIFCGENINLFKITRMGNNFLNCFVLPLRMLSLSVIPAVSEVRQQETH